MQLILHYLKRYKKLFVLNIISVFGFALVELGIPTIVSEMIDNGIMNQDKQYLIRMGIVIAVISLIGVSGTILLGYCCAKISTSVTRDIREDVSQKEQTFSHNEMNQFGIASLITRTNNDAFQIMTFLNVILRTALLTPIMIIVSFTLTIRSSLNLSLIIASTVPVIILGVVIVGKISGPLSDRQQNSLDRINRIFRENLTGIRVIRSFNNDGHESERFDSENSYFMEQSQNLFKLMSSTEPVFFLLMNLAALCIYLTAANMIDAQTLQVGKLVAFMEYLFHAMFSVMLFCMVFMLYPRASISAKRIMAVLNTETSIENHPGNAQTDSGSGEHSVIFEHVDFVYPDGEEAVLKDISFSAKSGETVAFIGSTGSGKSSLIQLIPRFYDRASGNIYIDGQKIEDLDINALRSKIGFVPQKASLFEGSLRDNMKWGKEDATDEEIYQALDIAQAREFVDQKEQGLDFRIEQNGGNLSGGQKQRLTIARALVRKPEILILDDSASALDFATDARLRKAIKENTDNMTVFLVSQRVSTIRNADHILVLDDGKIAGIGTHLQLLKENQVYKEICASQMAGEEA